MKDNSYRMSLTKYIIFFCYLPILVAFPTISLAQLTLEDSLVAYYPFTGNAMDSSGNGYNGVVTGATLITDRFGNANSAYDFNGGQYISVSPINTFDTLTISCWTSCAQYQNGAQRIIDIGGRKAQYMMLDSTDVLCWFSGDKFTDTYTLGLNSWQHLTLVLHGNIASFYANATFIDTVLLNPTGNSDQTLYIGSENGIQYFYNGAIDDIRIYNRALDQCEILQLYELGTVTTLDVLDDMICVNDSTSIIVLGSDPLKTYQLQDTSTGNLIGPALNGTGDSLFLSTGQLTSTTSFGIIKTDTTTACQTNLNSINTIIVTPNPVAQFTDTANGLKYDFTDQSTGNIASWNWDFGDGNTSSQQNPSYTYGEEGIYNVCLTVIDSNGCENTSCDSISVSATGIQTKEGPVTITIYPNPNNGILHFELDGSKIVSPIIRILDILGRQVLYSELMTTDHQYSGSINIAFLPPGIYLFEIRSNDQLLSRKFIKTNTY